MGRRLQVRAYDTVTGQPLYTIPFTSVKYTRELSVAGSLEVEVAWGEVAEKLNMYWTLLPWKTSIAYLVDGVPVQAGPVGPRKWDAAARKLTISAPGAWGLMEQRLVLNPKLASSWRDGEVLIDEEHPAGDWAWTVTGSYPHIAAQLVKLAMDWGQLPIDLPTTPAGSYTRTYLGPDLATVATRLKELGEVKGGPEMLFEPYLTDTGLLRWRFLAADQIKRTDWVFNESKPGQRIRFTGYSESDAAMCSQVFEIGGRNEDRVLVCRATSTTLEENGYPLLQIGDKSHTTVSDLDTLRSWAAGTIAAGDRPAETWTVTVGAEWPIQPGDLMYLKIVDPFTGEQHIGLRVTAVSGDETDWLTLSTQTIGG